KQVVLDRVLGRHDVDVDVVDLGERRVQRRRLTRTRWTGDKHHSIRIGDRFHQLPFGTRLDAERSEVEGQVTLVENTENDLLAEQGREGRDTEIDDLGADFELDATVLGDT